MGYKNPAILQKVKIRPYIILEISSINQRYSKLFRIKAFMWISYIPLRESSGFI